MSTGNSFTGSTLTRRGFIAAAGAVGLTAALAACSTGGGSSSSTLKFWDMQWGPDARYNNAAKKIATGFSAKKLSGVSYQVVSWSNFGQTFSAAIASKTGPAVSSGGGFQAFQYAKQGSIAYADDLLGKLKTNGVYDDFVPGVLAPMKTPDGYAAIPWNLDVVALWYRKSILDEVGVSVPTTWDEYLSASEALAKKGYYSFGMGCGSDNSFGYEAMFALMINNGGGLFDADGNLDVVSDANVEAMTFVQELQKAGALDPGSVSYSTANMLDKWSSKKFAMGWYDGYLDSQLNAKGDLLVGDPLVSSSGKKGTVQYINNLMMFTNTPSQSDSEDFLAYYMKNLGQLWDKKLVPDMPALKSIRESAAFQADSQAVKIAEAWQPVSKSIAAQSTALTPKLAAIDGGQAMYNLAQTMIVGSSTPKAALVTLENALKAALSS